MSMDLDKNAVRLFYKVQWYDEALSEWWTEEVRETREAAEGFFKSTIYFDADNLLSCPCRIVEMRETVIYEHARGTRLNPTED
jgi:hypothetical protein